MMPSMYARVRFSPAKMISSPGTSSSLQSSRAHTPSDSQGNRSFFGDRSSLFGNDDDLDEPSFVGGVGNNPLAKYVERIARDRSDVATRSVSRESSRVACFDAFVRDQDNIVGVKTPLAALSNSAETSASTSTTTPMVSENNMVVSDTLRTIENSISERGVVGQLTTPVRFDLERSLLLESHLEAQSYEILISSTASKEIISERVMNETRSQRKQLTRVESLHSQIELDKSPTIQTELNGVHESEDLSITQHKVNHLGQLGLNMGLVGSPIKLSASSTVRNPSSLRKLSSRSSTSSNESIGSPKGSSRRRLRRATLLDRVVTELLAHKIYYGCVGAGWVVLTEVFKVWWELVSAYSPRETMERDLREISFWFTFCLLLIVFFTFFVRID